MLKQSILLSLVSVSGVILNSVCVPYLQPLFGVRYADILEIPLLLFIIWHAAQITVWNLEDKRSSTSSTRTWWFTTPLVVGLLGLVWLFMPEVAITATWQGAWLWDAIYICGIARDVAVGSMYWVALLAYTVMPWIAWNAQIRDDAEGDKLIWDFDEVKPEQEEYCTRREGGIYCMKTAGVLTFTVLFALNAMAGGFKYIHFHFMQF